MRDFYKYTTRVPNDLFDQNLKYLSLAELKILLIIIRQTIGWKDARTGKPKTKDWISRSFFQKRSGLSYKSISLGIAGLIQNGLIVTMDRNGYILQTPQERRGKKKIYYAYAPFYEEPTLVSRVKKLVQLGKKIPYTKGIHTKVLSSDKKYLVDTEDKPTIHISQTHKISDHERYLQILNEQNKKY